MSSASSAPGLHVLGVTGGVGSGKSTAAKLLAEALKGVVLDADAIVTELLQSAEVLDCIELKLGVVVRDEAGALDRTLLADHIFAHPGARETLEGVLHPAVREQMWLGMQAAEEKGGAQWVILDVPLLREGGLDRLCDRIVHVGVPAETRCARACARHGWTAEQWEAREAAQMEESEKATRADAILANHAGLEALSQQVEALVVSLHCLPPRTLRDRWPAWNLEPSS